MANRRESLKIIGTIGATCAYPFSADELFGQHVHVAAPLAAAKGPYTPKFFHAAEYAMLSRITDLIIPKTETPGAVEAGVPEYIDAIVHVNTGQRTKFRKGLEWMDRESRRRFGRKFLQLSEVQQVDILTPLCAAADAGKAATAGERFFQVVKNMTADGYYTSRVGLVQELGYAGNTVLERFPECIHEH
ncbi:MAG: gluconate 2-dehydrogenase subunit 3 family protein [Bryobacteraceae bacterium]